MLYTELSKIIDEKICINQDIFDNFKQRIQEGRFTRDENPQSHFCVYFLPFNSKTKEVFIVHHKKSGLWISPGGHIDKEEMLLETLNREIEEELGMKAFFKNRQSPFLLTTAKIEKQELKCKKHFDIWYLLKTDGKKFKVDPREFYDTKWLTIDEAEKIITDISNKKALQLLN